MKRRTGMTLIEVLVAIFIMAIGLMALLTLFPIGMLRMAQAIRDARSAQSGQAAHSLSLMQDMRNDPLVVSQAADPYNKNLPNADLFVNPSRYNTLTGQPYPAAGTLPDADPYGESYALFVDPIGTSATPVGSSQQNWVSGLVGPGGLRRRDVAYTGGFKANILRNFSIGDDINFDPTILPGTPQMAGASVLRDTRFSWAYLLRRPQTIDRSVVDCSIVIFDQRTVSLTNSLSLEEYLYPNTVFNPSNSTITIDATANVASDLRPGDWILDSSFYQKVAGGPGAANAYFYRVVASEDLGGNQVRYEVQTPIRGYLAQMNPNGYTGTAIIIRGIAEVIEKGPGRMP